MFKMLPSGCCFCFQVAVDSSGLLLLPSGRGCSLRVAVASPTTSSTWATCASKVDETNQVECIGVEVAVGVVAR